MINKSIEAIVDSRAATPERGSGVAVMIEIEETHNDIAVIRARDVENTAVTGVGAMTVEEIGDPVGTERARMRIIALPHVDVGILEKGHSVPKRRRGTGIKTIRTIGGKTPHKESHRASRRTT